MANALERWRHQEHSKGRSSAFRNESEYANFIYPQYTVLANFGKKATYTHMYERVQGQRHFERNRL